MKKYIIAGMLVMMSHAANADNSTDHKCMQDLLDQHAALQNEYASTGKYNEFKIDKIRLNFNSIMKPADRQPIITAGGDSIATNYGICDIPRSQRYKLLRSAFETLLPGAKK